MHAEFLRGAVQVDDELVHAHAPADAHELGTVRSVDAQRATGFVFVARARLVESGGGAVDAVGVPDRHDRDRRALAGQVDTAVRQAAACGHVFDRAQLRLQRHGRGEPKVARRAHRRVRLVPVQRDARAHQVVVDLRARERGRGVRQVAHAWVDAAGAQFAREPFEPFDLHVGLVHESGVLRSVGHGEVAPLPHHVEHAFVDERAQCGDGLGQLFEGEAVAPEAGVHFDMHAGGEAGGAGRVGDAFDGGQRGHGQVDTVGDQLTVRRAQRIVDPSEDVRAVGPDAGGAQQQRLPRLRRAKPCGASRERGERDRNQPVPVGVGLDHAHDFGRAAGFADDTHQMPHVVADRGEVHDGLCGVGAACGVVVRFALGVGKRPFFSIGCAHRRYCASAM